MVDYIAIGRRISLNRRMKRITQAKLAEMLDISVSYVGQVESGKTKVSLSRLDQIADILEIDVAMLVSDGSRFEDYDFKSEIEENIKGWSDSERSMLLDFIYFVNSKKKSN